MNNKGWGLNDFIKLLSILFLCLIVVMILTHNMKNKLENKPVNEETTFVGKEDVGIKNYIELEDKMTLAANHYLEKESTDTIIIKLTMLIKKGVLANVRDPKNGKECSGYVVYTGETKEFKAYLSCPGNYQTSDYNKNLE